DKGPAVTLFCRPRRFGKSLNLSMLQRFFEIPVGVDEGKSYADLFEGLAIWDARDGHYRAHQGAYPVVRFTLNNLKSVSYPDFISWFSDAVAEECNRHDYLLESDRLSEFDKDAFGQLASGRAEIGQLGRSLLRLTILLQQHYGQSVVVLIDEYDAPVMAAHESGCYDEVVSFLKRWLTGALKSNDALAFAVLTGVQRISKESIFSDLNNLQVDTPLNVASDERWFTGQEALAEYVGARQCVSARWYVVTAGDVDVYNPSAFSITSVRLRARVYWGKSSNLVSAVSRR
ncbi:MAG: AAA family ATPase, partial [Adlercreutzia sp.]